MTSPGFLPLLHAFRRPKQQEFRGAAVIGEFRGAASLQRGSSTSEVSAVQCHGARALDLALGGVPGPETETGAAAGGLVRVTGPVTDDAVEGVLTSPSKQPPYAYTWPHKRCLQPSKRSPFCLQRWQPWAVGMIPSISRPQLPSVQAYRYLTKSITTCRTNSSSFRVRCCSSS